MRFNTGRTGGGQLFTLPVLMAAAFTVSVGYGVVLPRLPRLIEQLLGPGVEAAQVSWHTGLLTAVYTVKEIGEVARRIEDETSKTEETRRKRVLLQCATCGRY